MPFFDSDSGSDSEEESFELLMALIAGGLQLDSPISTMGAIGFLESFTILDDDDDDEHDDDDQDSGDMGAGGQSQMAQRHQRLENGPVVLLYHQTSEECAREILSSGRMLRGQGGLAGGGIYFAESAEATDQKAHQKGVVLQAWVKLGHSKTVQDGASDATFWNLLNEGYDSVCITNRASGKEYIVYNYDQVTDIKRYHRGRF